MAAAWGRAKRALATKLCIRMPERRAGIEVEPPVAAAESPAATVEEEERVVRSPAASARQLSSFGSRRSKKTCAICLGGMRPGHGQALFTAECSHKFHFHCISSNVKHGNYICPICRAEWKELPFQGNLPADATHGRARVNPFDWPQDDGHVAVVRSPYHAGSASRQEQLPVFRSTSEVSVFNDDEQINLLSETVDGIDSAAAGLVQIKTHSEFPAVQQFVTQESFTILIHLKAPSSLPLSGSRSPLDLVTVLDVSGSMAGTKLALLKCAMSFVIQTLGPSDRLSIVAFSTTARRLFPLRKMTLHGRRQALQAVNSLVASGGTDIADGLKKGAKVMDDRHAKNPVCSMILLSDGQDNSTVSSSEGGRPDYSGLMPPLILPGTGHHVQIHTFGFGADHDSAAMHSIAVASGGTFSFIDAEGSIRDAFAQCIGGLLSVVVQEMRLGIVCVDEGVLLTCIRSGSYASRVARDRQLGFVDVGDLYADEERDFLVTVHVPAAHGQTVLIKPSCTYRDTATMETVELQGEEVIIQRPVNCVVSEMSPEVERELHRIEATEDMSAARAAAERGDFSQAVSVLEVRRRILESRAARSGSEPQILALVAELREMQERVESRRRYEESGRAYMLAGLSSHSSQRATARGDSTELTSLIHTYQTPLMVDMLQRSQTLVPSPALNRSPTLAPSRSSSSPRLSGRSVRSTKSFSGRTA